MTNDITVAHAAPETPISRRKIMIGSRTMLTSAPTTCMAMERLAAPSPRSIPDTTPLRMMKNDEM